MVEPAGRADPRSLPPASGYFYALPGGWIHLDVDPARRAASVRRAVSERIRREPRLAPHLAGLDRLLTHECVVAAANGAERLSLLAEPAAGSVVTAATTFVVATLPGASAGVPAGLRAGAPEQAPVDATAVVSWLAPEHARALASDPAAELAVVPLAQLDAVRRRWTETSPTAAGEGLTHRQVQLVIPWPGRPRVGLLTMSSPCPPLWPVLEAVFDACSATFHWTWASGVAY